MYPVSEVETQAVIDFISRYIPEFKTQPRKNICGVLLFSKFDNLAAGTGIECGTPTFPEPPRAAQPAGMTRMMFFMGRRGQQPAQQQPRPTDPQPKTTNAQDKPLFERVSEKYKEITGIKSAVSEKPAGSMLEWGYFQHGVPTFSANLWSLREEQRTPQAKMKRDAQAGPAQTRATQTVTMDRQAMMRQFMQRSAPSAAQTQSTGNDEKWLKWIDDKNEGKGFVSWTKFDHKQLGEVEIGGFRPFATTNPPPEDLAGLGRDHGEFVARLAGMLPRVTIVEAEVTAHGGGIYTVAVEVENSGYLPTALAQGVRSRSVANTMVQLQIPPDDLISGSPKTTFFPALAGSGSRESFTWVIRGERGAQVELRLRSQKGGHDSAMLTLR